MIKRLGGAKWRLLHKLAYVIGGLGVLHFLWLAKKGRTTPYYLVIALALLLGARVWDCLRKRSHLAQADQKGPDARRRPAARVERRRMPS
jgi:sulfoxide reductase heme-binding subunit YedZ